jgi:hypothetical protein
LCAAVFDLLDSHTLERGDEAPQAFHAGIRRSREIDHDSNLYATYRQEEGRLRDEHGGLDIRRVILDAPAFSYLRPIETGNEGLVGPPGFEPGTSRL